MPQEYSAKHSLNFELSPAIWNGQILPYRTVLSKISEDDLLWQTNRFFTGRAKISPPFLLGAEASLLSAFTYWAKSLTVKPYISVTDIYTKIFSDIQNQSIVSVVLADVFRTEVWESRPRDNKGYAYFVCSGVGGNFKLETTWDNIQLSTSVVYSGTSLKGKTWAEIERKKREVAPEPNTLRPMLSKEAVDLYDHCLKNLTRLGWDGQYLKNKKSFVITFSTSSGPLMRINVGLPDYDAKSHRIEDRLAGAAGFKFDISLKSLLHNDHFKEIGFAFAMRLIKEANYRARGAGQHFGTRELSEREFNKWDGDLHHWTSDDERDFVGRPIDKCDIDAVFKILKDLINTGETSGENSDGQSSLAATIDNTIFEAGNLKKLFVAMSTALSAENLMIVYSGAKESVEIHLPDEKYPLSIGSIQYCHPRSGDYLEVRFKRVHLQHVGLLEKVDSLRDNAYRKDAASLNPEAIRFQFKSFDEAAVEFIEIVAQIVRQEIPK